MQAWGTHTYENFRPSNLFPTPSGLLGLLGACLGIDRRDQVELERLAASVAYAVRVDRGALRPEAEVPVPRAAVKLPDFHTVLAARKVDGSANKNPVVSHREYLFDAAFTVAVGSGPMRQYAWRQSPKPCSGPASNPFWDGVPAPSRAPC